MPTIAARIIQVADLNSSDHHRRVLEAFDDLAPGESLVVVADHHPREVLRWLAAEKKGLFEWSPLEIGPSSFRTEISRRAAPPGARREISEALAWDHDRLDALEQRAFASFAGGDALGASVTWSEFSVGLKRHIRFEEEILFPTFEEHVGISPAEGPTRVMRDEHREIERLLEAIGHAFTGGAAALPLRDDLRALLGQHNLKEEDVLYPGTDRCLEPEERDALVARIQGS